MTLTVDSDLNGPSPQFTLTCISTGGPATTVTWTRDSVTVTEGTETVLDDPVTAQYTHTLTVTGRLGGLYTCTVANNKHNQLYLPTSVKFISYFSVTGAVISRYETVLSADVDSTDVAIDIDKDGYEHIFALQYIYTSDNSPAPVPFVFGKILAIC